ncbi:MAG: hypothetical protein ACOX41_00930 [Anaerovoracaceae bacterium]|jgi:Flp pilus assembly protein TadB
MTKKNVYRTNGQMYRRQTKAAQFNMMKKQQEEDQAEAKKQKRNRKLFIAIAIVIGALIVVSIFFAKTPITIALLCVFGAFAAFVWIYGRRQQKNGILRLKKQGWTKGQFLKSLEMRGEKQRNIDVYAKLWDKYKAPSADD